MFQASRCFLFLLLSTTSIFVTNAEELEYPENYKPKVVIIGAGAAGIAAASKLLKHGGFRVDVLEAEERYGGRIYNLYKDNYYKALGAEWTPDNIENKVYNMLKKANAINEKWTPKPGVYAKSNGDALSFEQLSPYIEALSQNKSNDLCASSHSEEEFYHQAFMNIPNNDLDDNVGRNIPKFMNITIHSPCNWNETASPLTGDQKQPFRGMPTVLDVIMGNYPNPELPDMWKKVIQMGKTVTKVSWDHMKPGISIKRKSGLNTFRSADHVIVTIPLGVLKAHHLTLFEPHLPEKHQKVINALRVGVENNIYLTFENRWWPKGYDLFVIWTKDDVKNLAKSDAWLSKIEGFVPVDDTSAVLAVHTMELENSSSETLSDQEVIGKIMWVLRKAFNNKGWNITDPISIDHSRWGTNPNFLGSITDKGFEAFEANVTNSDLAEGIRNKDGKLVMLFAGEATHDRFSSSVHGAVESGFNAAMKIIDLYKANNN